MAKKRKKIAPKKIIKTEKLQPIEKNKSALLRWGESYTSLLLGIVVVVIGILFFASFFKTKHTQQVSSTNTELEITTSQPTIIPTPQSAKTAVTNSQMYTVQSGDDLWHIAEKFYKSGYNWVDIARANNLENPGTVFSGNKLVIPVVTPAQQTIISQITPATQSNQEIITARQNSGTEAAIKTETYIVQKGDDLWNISVRAYADGYRWNDIAKANNLTNPDLIHSGNILKIPR